MKKIILIGAGGHANSVYDVIKCTKKFLLEGVLDQNISYTKFNSVKMKKQESFLKLNKKKKKYSFIICKYL